MIKIDKCKNHGDTEFVCWAGKWKCRLCQNESQRKHYLKSATRRAKIRANNKKAVEEKQRYILEYLKLNPCNGCGESDPIVLDFDHLDPSKKKFNISGMLGHCMKTIKDEIEKCQVLCSNCHRRKTSIQLNHYKSR